MDDVAIKVEHVSKNFKLPHDKQTSIKGGLIHLFKKGKRTYEKQEVLNDISFEIKRGEFFGIVGRNGSGKSTLLKLLAKIYVPTAGNIVVNGSLTPFIELGVGFNPELTGRENVYLNGALLGFSRAEMQKMYNDIVDFAELERFMDQKLKNYSSGMQVRLAFSIAIRAQSDILLLDEVLAVGDEAFQRKCYAYFDQLKRNNKTVVIVTHDMSAVEKFCDRAMLIEKGQIIEQGEPHTVAHAYSRLFTPEITSESDGNSEVAPEDSSRTGDGRFRIGKVSVHQDDPHDYDSAINLDFSVVCNEPVNGDVIAAYAVKDSSGQALFGAKFPSKQLANAQKGDEVSLGFTFPNILYKGEYVVDVSVYAAKDKVFCDCWIDSVHFRTDTDGVEGYSIVVNSTFLETAGKRGAHK